MINNKSKRIIIILLDLIIGLIVKVWASKMFPNSNDVLLPILFFVFLLPRIIIDLSINTIEDKYYKLKIECDLEKLTHANKIYKSISEEMNLAIKTHDTNKYKELDKIMKKL